MPWTFLLVALGVVLAVILLALVAGDRPKPKPLTEPEGEFKPPPCKRGKPFF